MSTDAAAPVQAEGPGLPQAPGAAAARFIERQEAGASKPPEAKADAKAEEKPAAAKVEGKPAPKIDPNVVRREREAREAGEKAEALLKKFGGLDEALGKRDFVRAMTLLAETHGATFADFVEAFEKAGETKPVDPAEVARKAAAAEVERLEKERTERSAAEKKEADEKEAKALEERVTAMRTRLQDMAESDGERWELTAVGGLGGAAWDLIEAYHAETGEKLTLEQALDKVETKLKEKRDGLRAKKTSASPGAGGNGRNEAGANAQGGRAAEPPINNRTTSGAPAVVVDDPNRPVSFGSGEVARVMRKIGIRG